MEEKKRFWLMKSEPGTYSIDDLKRDKRTIWDGVRNYRARNFMMKEMKRGDGVLFYHSNAEPPCVAGLAKVSKTAIVDPTQFQKESKYFDSKSTKEKPRWFCVEVGYIKKFKHPIALEKIRQTKTLQKMWVIKRGMRLSIQPVTQKEFQILDRMGA